MMMGFVVAAPEERECRNRNDHAPTCCKPLPQGNEAFLVLTHMFQHIQRDNHVERFAIGRDTAGQVSTLNLARTLVAGHHKRIMVRFEGRQFSQARKHI